MLCLLNSDTWILDALTDHLHFLKKKNSEVKMSLSNIYEKMETIYTEFGLKHFILRPKKSGAEILEIFDLARKFSQENEKIRRTYDFNDM